MTVLELVIRSINAEGFEVEYVEELPGAWAQTEWSPGHVVRIRSNLSARNTLHAATHELCHILNEQKGQSDENEVSANWNAANVLAGILTALNPGVPSGLIERAKAS